MSATSTLRAVARHRSDHSLWKLEHLERRVLLTIPGTTLGVWDSYATLTAELNTIHNAYPDLTRLISIGKTVQNRDIWAIQITDNPGIEEDEPEFYYQGSMHGDEPVGMEMTFYFMQHLLENYGTDTRITNLVNNMDIWIVPNMNWDGYSWSPAARRGNANNVDLNRNFPEWTQTAGGFGNMFDGPAPSLAGRQVETVAMINWRRSRSFVASANFHGGAQVVNYPWDSNGNGFPDYSATPDDALFREMARTYANQNPAILAGGFPGGITNGDQWYEVYGGMQDWATLYTGSLETTIELTNTKFPSASTLPGTWNNNREAMLQYLEAANWGVRGIITSANSGAPLAAKVTVIAPAPVPTPSPSHPATQWVFSDGDVGDYHRMLLPGTYTIRFEAPGYQTQTISDIVVATRTNDPNATFRLDVQMIPLDTTPPVVAESSFRFRTGPQAVSFRFSEDVSASLSVSDLVLHNDTTGTTLDPVNFALGYDSGSDTATFTFPGFALGILPDGSYTATLPAGSVTDPAGNPLAGYSFGFFFLQGDASRDGRVNLNDFNILAANFGQSGRDFTQADFNYDAIVNLEDFNLLASRFGNALPAAPAGTTAGAFSSFGRSRIGDADYTDDPLGELIA